MGEEDAVAAAMNLQWDAGVLLSNLQILSQFATSLHRMSTEMFEMGMGHVVFPSQEVTARRRDRLGRHSIWPLWDYGVVRRALAILGMCRLHPAMCA